MGITLAFFMAEGNTPLVREVFIISVRDVKMALLMPLSTCAGNSIVPVAQFLNLRISFSISSSLHGIEYRLMVYVFLMNDIGSVRPRN